MPRCPRINSRIRKTSGPSSVLSQVIILPFLALVALQAQDIPKWAEPPGDETPQIAKLIDQAKAELAGGASTSKVLCDPKYRESHPYQRFREAIKNAAGTAPITLVADDEPGEKAVVKIQVTDSEGAPAQNALVYIYHTSSKGMYSDKGIHIRANAGDATYAQFFGYIRTNQNGFAEVKTIRPAGYPNGELPAHYHIEIFHATRGTGTEIVFDDDPRLNAQFRERSIREGFVLTSPKKGPEGWWRISAVIKLAR